MEQEIGRPDGKSPGTDLDVHGSNIHSFIIKLWVEPAAEKSTSVSWRGNITHVPDGRRQYLRELEDITAFIEPYIKEMNIAVRRRVALVRWLRSWGRHKTGAGSSD
ncbi:MAG: hypothetical protein QOH49_70 [Acidobacteriota bacterium]|jgi:hypothetical protein|nr:hypothetical protein [Acidobacteriota bacterium]